MRLLIIAFYILFTAISQKIIGDEVVFRDNPTEILKYGDYRWGDSPKDNNGIPIWTYKELESFEWKPLKFPGWPKNRKNHNYLWERIRLPLEYKWHDPSLYFKVDELVEVYIGEKLIYRFGDLENPKYIGNPFFIIPLKPEYFGKYVFFRIYSSNKRYIGIYGTPKIGSKGDIIYQILKKDISKFVIGVFGIIISFIALASYLFSTREDYILLFSATALTMGSFIISQPDLKFLIYTNPLFWAYMDIFSLHLMQLSFFWFIYFIFKNENKYIRRTLLTINILNSILVPIILILILTKQIKLYNTVGFTTKLMLLEIIITFLISVYLAFKKREEAILLFLGFVFLFLPGAIDILVAIRIIPYAPSYTHYGMLLFFLSLIGMVINRTRNILENYANINKELAIARNIQFSILPERKLITEKILGNVLYLPSRVISGDFYDYNVKERKLTVLIADVSGHGIPAALASSMLKLAFNSLKHIEKPSEILININRMLKDNVNILMSANIVTIEEDKFLIARAGHFPLIIIKENKELIEIAPKGVIMGFADEIYVEDYEGNYEIGDRFVLYTDGIIEARNPKKEIFGLDRFKEFLINTKNLPPEKVAEELHITMQKWTKKTSMEDDITFITLDRIR